MRLECTKCHVEYAKLGQEIWFQHANERYTLFSRRKAVLDFARIRYRTDGTIEIET
jgi:hypothetical protein